MEPDGIMADGNPAGALERLGLAPAELVARFESLGENCELGEVQRRFGAEPLGLFRWSNPSPEAILRGLERDFADLGRNARVELNGETPLAEWILFEPDYQLMQHTHVREGELPQDVVERQQLGRFHLLRRKLLEDIEQANKIFVIKSQHDLPLETVTRIARALRRKGPTWLLWVVADEEPGRVDLVEEGLLRGRIDYLLRTAFNGASFANWLTLLANAFELVSSLGDAGACPPPRVQDAPA